MGSRRDKLRASLWRRWHLLIMSSCASQPPASAPVAPAPAAPAHAMVKFGIPPIAAHFFILYYAVISTITPCSRGDCNGDVKDRPGQLLENGRDVRDALQLWFHYALCLDLPARPVTCRAYRKPYRYLRRVPDDGGLYGGGFVCLLACPD